MPNDQDLRVVYRNPNDLAAYERNSRLHSPEQIAKLRASLREFGFTNPILLRDDERTIGAGHARHQASILEKLDRVPTITLRGLSDEQWRAYVIADNQLAITGSSWDESILRLELDALRDAGLDLSLTGFSSLELTNLFASQDGATDPDDEPDAPPEPITVLGDVWDLGPHRLVCGDATLAATVALALNGAKPHACFTDPPYGTDYDAGRRGREFLNDGTNRSTGNVVNDHRADWREAWALFPGDVIIVWHDGANPAATQLALEACKFEVRSPIIWRKPQAVVGPPRGHYRFQHEQAMYAVRKGGNGHWNGSRKENTIWDADRPKRNDTGHVSQKPVELWRRPLENHTKPGDHVYDPFAGSGVCIIAAQMTSRVAHCIELDPSHVDRCLLRYKNFSGVEPKLSDGRTFSEVRRDRLDDGEVL